MPVRYFPARDMMSEGVGLFSSADTMLALTQRVMWRRIRWILLAKPDMTTVDLNEGCVRGSLSFRRSISDSGLVLPRVELGYLGYLKVRGVASDKSQLVFEGRCGD